MRGTARTGHGGSTARVVAVGLGIALFIGVVLTNFAATTPDALERVVLDVACEQATDRAGCLADAEGEPVLVLAPRALAGYTNVGLSGLVGVLAAFAVGTGTLYLLRLTRRRRG